MHLGTYFLTEDRIQLVVNSVHKLLVGNVLSHVRFNINMKEDIIFYQYDFNVLFW